MIKILKTILIKIKYHKYQAIVNKKLKKNLIFYLKKKKFAPF